MKVEVKLTGLEGVLATLRELPPEIASKRGGPVRAALRKGARVIHKQAQANLRAVTANETASGRSESTGLLEKNLVITRGKKPTGSNGERFLVRVRRKGYPSRQDAGTRKSASLLEYGSSQQPAEPWLRPAFNARAMEALRTVETELVRAVALAVKKLAAKNRSRP
jgi:HK97 gp10 family phage protein